MKPAISTALLMSAWVAVFAAQESPLWLRYPAISPDGQTLLFEYKGDIWSVPAAGGNAVPLTLSESYEFAPVWSHDGKSVAFASDRYGSFDVFVMPATGGEAKRLTWHSTREVPSSFAADDKAVLFSAARQDLATHAQFPTGGMTELYSVPVGGGRVSLVLTTPALDATVSSKGDKIIFHDYKGYESDWRKHHTSAVTRDIWVYDTNARKYTQVSAFAGEDRNPVFDSNDNDFYYLTEQSGSFNVHKSSLRDPKQSVPITRFTRHPVRFLSRARTGMLAFSYDGELYTQTPGGQPQKVAVRIGADGRNAIEKFLPVDGGMTEAKLSPNGKEFVFAFRGEIFVSSIDGKFVKRITNTPWQERTASFSPDGRALVYAAEKDNNWNVYTISLTRASRAIFLRLDGVEGRGDRRNTGRGVPAGVFAGRQGDRLPREPADAEGLQHRIEAVANRAARRSQLFGTPTAISTTRGRRIPAGCWCNSPPGNASLLPRSGSSPPTASRRSAISPKAATTTRRRNGPSTAR